MSLRELLGIDLPILQAPMAGAQGGELAAAVSNAGGLGALPCALLTLDQLRDELSRLRAQTRAPYNVNFFCHSPPGPDAVREARWRAALLPFYREFGLDPACIAADAGRAPFTQAAADVVEAFRPAVVSFHFGLPPPELLARVRAWGSCVLSTATTVDEARWLEARGVDAIIAQGLEAGGHRGHFLASNLDGQTGIAVLVRELVRSVRVPVIAAGGIADAGDVSAVIGQGAAAVQVGTSYLLCREATTSAVHRAALGSPAAQTTTVTNVFTGRPARGIVNRLIRELGPMTSEAPEFPLAVSAVAPLRAHAERIGSGDFSPLWCGTKTSGCRNVDAASLTRELAAKV